MSDPMGKPRGNAVLKTLPAEQQAEIVDAINAPKATYRKVRIWCLQDRCIATNESSLRDFYSWFNLRHRWEKASARGLEVQELLSSADPSLSPDKVEAAGQLVFLNEAIEMGGAEGAMAFVNLSRLRLSQKAHEAELSGFKLKFEQKEREIEQRERAMALDREKFEFDAAAQAIKHAAAIKTIATNRSLDSDARVEQVRQRLFGFSPATEVKP